MTNRTYSDTQIIHALKEANGSAAAAARSLGCSRTVISKRAVTSEEIRVLLRHTKGRVKGAKRFDDEAIIKAVGRTQGLLSLAAEMVGCSRRTIELRAAQSEQVREAIYEARQLALDEAESHLLKAAKAGQPWAIKFALSTLGKARGYTTQPVADTNQTIVVDLPESFTWIEPPEEMRAS